MLLGLLPCLAACAPVPVPVPQAEQACARMLRDQGMPQSGVTLGLSAGNAWAVDGFGASGTTLGITAGGGRGTGVAVSTTVPSSRAPDFDAAYADCVRSRSGQPPQRSFATALSSLP